MKKKTIGNLIFAVIGGTVVMSYAYSISKQDVEKPRPVKK